MSKKGKEKNSNANIIAYHKKSRTTSSASTRTLKL